MTSLRSFVTVGPFSVQFTNRNRDMGLQAHTHFAQVTLTLENTDQPNTPGWPSFHDTNGPLAEALRDTLVRPITGTNETVARALWLTAADHVAHHEPHQYGTCSYRLHALELAVRGVPDAIGHDDSFTTYRIERTD